MKTCTIEMNSQKHPACKGVVGGIGTCPECGRPMCPVCYRHNVIQLSRVTGYIQDVAGWNAAKRQELIDRKRYELR
jgi:anaerobic ribonucleoside-triphosphate reductase